MMSQGWMGSDITNDDLEKMNSIVEMEAKQQEMEKRHVRARSAWRHLADNLSKEDIKKFLNYR